MSKKRRENSPFGDDHFKAVLIFIFKLWIILHTLSFMVRVLPVTNYHQYLNAKVFIRPFTQRDSR
jgi:hypothetical protein